MVLDQVENFIRVSVSGSHASGDSTISLQSGEASSLPDPSNGKYNLVWFDSQNYQLPDKDPNVEIVRVNSVDTANDTVSVTRGQENTTATTKSETGAEYELLLGPTAKTIQEIDQFKLDASAYSPEADTHTRYEDSEAISAINNDSDHGSTASHNYFSGSHNDLSNIGSSDHHTRYSDSEARAAVDGANVDISGNAVSLATSSFDISEDATTNELVISDSNNVELIRQPESGPTQFLQGVDAGPISAPEDSFTQLINAPVTSSLSSGSTVGYTLSLDNQSILSVEGEADGSGGIQNTNVVSGRPLDINSNDIVDTGTTIWDTSSQEIPDAALGTVSISTLSSNSVTVAGNSVSLGSSTSVNHSDLSNIGSSDHHTKTTSASELTDVSPDSNSSAHHSRYADSEAISAINNDTDHGSTASHNYFSGSHNDLSDVGSSDHHTKTTSASELTDVSPDSNSSAHHSRYADSEAISAINNDSDHGSTASHNYFSGSHNDLSDVGSND